MIHRRCFAVFAGMGSCLLAFSGTVSGASLELYPNFETMGVIVTLAAGEDTDENAQATLEYRTDADAYSAGFPLTRTRSDQLVGSLFWLDPGTTYDVRVNFSDPGGSLHGTTLSGSQTTRSEIVVPAPISSYHVSPHGTGSVCTSGAPCSLSTGVSSAGAGDEVVLHGGTYFEGEIWMPSSGTAGAPIVLRAASGETPILDGADPAAFTWNLQSGGVYATTVNVGDPYLVMADGERLFPYQSLSDLQGLVHGIPGFYAAGTSVSVRLAGNANPNGATMAVSRYNYCFEVAQDFVYFIGLTFRHYGQGSYAKAIFIDGGYSATGGSDNLVRDCTFVANDLDIGIKREAHRNLIELNDFSDTIYDWDWEAVKYDTALESGGVIVYDPMDGRGNVIRDNTFHDDFDGFGVCPLSDTGTTIEIDVHDNLGYDLGDDGMETDGYCSNLRIWGNTFHDVLIGISLAPVETGPVYAVRNLIYRTGSGTSSYSGMPFKFNSGYDTSGTIYLFHNTADAVLADNDGFEIRQPGSWDLIHSRNNIWSGTRYALSNDNPTQPLDLDYDDLYTTGSELAWWDGHGELTTLTELRSATGQELNGFNVVPGFAAAASGDYTLGSSSQLIDVGVAIPGINDDYEGLLPDLGAFEAGVDTIFSDGFESGGTTEWSSTVP